MRMKTRGCWPLALSALQHQAFMNAEETEKFTYPHLFNRPRGLFRRLTSLFALTRSAGSPDGLLDFQISMSAVNGMIYAVWDYCFLYLYHDNMSRLFPSTDFCLPNVRPPSGSPPIRSAHPAAPTIGPRQSVQLAVHLCNTLDKFQIHALASMHLSTEPLEPNPGTVKQTG